MREAEFASALQGTMFVDDVAIFLDDPNRNLSIGGGDRNLETRGHVLDDARCDTAERDQLIAGSYRFRLLLRRLS